MKLIKDHSGGIKEIKLRDILELKKDYIKKNYITTLFPPIEIGSITLVDQIVLLIINQIVKPKKIIEIGTYLGYTTNLLLKNTNSHIFTIDLPSNLITNKIKIDHTLIYKDGDINDDYLRCVQEKKKEIYLKNITLEEKNRLTIIKSDSTRISFIKEFTEVQFVFIDGGHSYDIVKSDTENARSVVKNGVIIWHDFNSNIHSDVTKFLNEQAIHSKIFHIKGSLCAFEFII